MGTCLISRMGTNIQKSSNILRIMDRIPWYIRCVNQRSKSLGIFRSKKIMSDERNYIVSGRCFHQTMSTKFDNQTPSSIRERKTAVTSYYNQQSIDLASQKPSVRLTPATIMYSSITHDPLH